MGIAELRLDGNEYGITFAGKHHRVVSLHAPVIGEIKDVVGGAYDQGGDVLIFHQRAHAVEFLLVNGPRHSYSAKETLQATSGILSFVET